MHRMNVLVTGGAGFIGSHLARRLLVEGHLVTVLDNLHSGSRANVPAGATLIEADAGQESMLAALPDGRFDAVCHLAAQTSGAVSMEHPLYDFRSNAVSTLLLVRWCQQREVKRFIYASSMAVYGNPTILPVEETAALQPVSYYGVSKLASEKLLRVAADSGLATTALRMFNVYGPGQNLANLRQGMASIYLAYLLKREAVPVTGSLRRFRDFVYIDDVIDAWVRVLALPVTPSLEYNIGSGTVTTVRELLDVLIDACGLPADHPVLERPAPTGDQFGLTADCRRAGTELGWQPRVSREMGMKLMVEWARTTDRS